MFGCIYYVDFKKNRDFMHDDRSQVLQNGLERINILTTLILRTLVLSKHIIVGSSNNVCRWLEKVITGSVSSRNSRREPQKISLVSLSPEICVKAKRK